MATVATVPAKTGAIDFLGAGDNGRVQILLQLHQVPFDIFKDHHRIIDQHPKARMIAV